MENDRWRLFFELKFDCNSNLNYFFFFCLRERICWVPCIILLFHIIGMGAIFFKSEKSACSKQSQCDDHNKWINPYDWSRWRRWFRAFSFVIPHLIRTICLRWKTKIHLNNELIRWKTKMKLPHRWFQNKHQLHLTLIVPDGFRIAYDFVHNLCTHHLFSYHIHRYRLSNFGFWFEFVQRLHSVDIFE